MRGFGQKLEKIVWPHVRGKIEKRIDEIQREYYQPYDDENDASNIIVIEAALLLETDWHDLLDGLWVIRSSSSVATRRITETRGLTEDEAAMRIRAQDRRRGIGRSSVRDDDDDDRANDELHDEMRNGVVTAVITNEGSLGDLEESLRKALFDPSSFKRGDRH
jgi:dephospho-CoA kinase